MRQLNPCRNCGNIPSMKHIMTKKFKSQTVLRGAMTGDYRVYKVQCRYCPNSTSEYTYEYQAADNWNRLNPSQI